MQKQKKMKVTGWAEQDYLQLVGSVSESAAAHKLRHPVPLAECARCQWLLWGPGWKAKQGSHRRELIRCGRGREENIQWVGERSVSRGGAWALGCVVCAQAKARLQVESQLQARQQHGRLCSKWSRFEVCVKTLKADSLSAHAKTEGHKMALEMSLCPETLVRELLRTRSVEDTGLLKGSVPQPSD